LKEEHNMPCKSTTLYDIESCDGEAIVDALLDGHGAQLAQGLGVGWVIDLTVLAEGGDEIVVELEVFDAEGNPLEEVRHLVAWLSDAAGGAPTAVAADADVVISGGINLIEHTTDIYFELLTDVNGEADFTIGDTGTPTFYLNVVQGDGTIFSSTAITFA
jgi:hypothetical protein